MEEVLDKNYFYEEEIFSAFHPRHRKKAATLLEAIWSVIAYTLTEKHSFIRHCRPTATLAAQHVVFLFFFTTEILLSLLYYFHA